MPTSATGSCNFRRHALRAHRAQRALTPTQSPRGLRGGGFTLIELLVVIAIFGILTTAVALTTTPDPRRAAAADAQRLALLLEAAQIEAQAGRRQIAWTANTAADGYSFWEAENARAYEQRWQPLSDDERFHARRFSAGLRLGGVEVDGQPLPHGEFLVFRRGDPPLFHIALEGRSGQGGQTGLGLGSMDLRGLPTGRVELRTAAASSP